MASTALTIRDSFSAGMFGGGDENKQASGGSILGALAGIQGTLDTLVGLTQESLNIDKKDQLQEKTELRAEKIAAGETDIPPEIKDTGPGILGSLKGAAGSLWAGMGAKTAFAAVVGGLALLTKFSDQLVGPLTKVLEWIRDDMVPSMTELYKDIKSWWFTSWTAVKTFFTTIKGAFNAVKNWLRSFDVDKSGTGFLGLDPKEWETLVDEMQTIVWNAITDFAIGAVKSVAVSLLTFTFFGVAMKKLLNNSALLGAVGAKGAVGKVAKGSRLSKLKWGRGLSLAAVILTGALELVDAVKTGYTDAVTDQAGETQNFKWSEFFGGMLGGSAEGGWFNAFAQAFQNVAVVGGLTYALMLAGVPLGPFGVGLGLVAGLTISGLIGFVSGLVGADRMGEFFADIGEGIWSVLSTIGNFFKSVWRGLKNMATGGSFMDAYNMSDLDVDVKKLQEMEKEVGLPKNITQEAAISALGEAPSAAKIKGGVKGAQWVHTKEYLEYQKNVNAINDLFALRASVAADSQALPGIIKEQLALANASLTGLEAAGPSGSSRTVVAQHNAKIKGLKKDIEQLKADLIIAENMAKGVFDDATAPSNIITFDRKKYLEARYPEKLTLDDIKVLNEDLKTKTLALDPNDNSLSKFQKSQLIINQTDLSQKTKQETFAFTGRPDYTPYYPTAVILGKGAKAGNSKLPWFD